MKKQRTAGPGGTLIVTNVEVGVRLQKRGPLCRERVYILVGGLTKAT